MKTYVRGDGMALLDESIDKLVVVVVGIGEMKTEGTTMVALRDCVPVVFASIVVGIVVNLIVVAVVDAAVVVETRVVDGPTTVAHIVAHVVTVVLDANVVAFHSVVGDVIVAVSAIAIERGSMSYYS